MTDILHHELWTAVRHLAQVWAQTPVASAMARELPKNAPHLAHDNAATVTTRLQGMKAGAGSLFSRPLLLGNVVETLRNNPFFQGGPGPKVDDITLKQWLNHAHAVEEAHDATIAWLRSRLPGYPILRIPHIAPNTHLTSRIPGAVSWDLADLADGIQALAAPANVPFFLGATPAQATALNQAAKQLAEALMGTPEWAAFAGAREQLTDSDRTEISAARTAIKASLRDFNGDGLDTYERHALRRQHAYDIINELGAGARHHCQTFDDIDELIQLSASDVLGQLVAYGDPALVSSNKIDLPRAGIVHLDIGADWATSCASTIRFCPMSCRSKRDKRTSIRRSISDPQRSRCGSVRVTV